MPKHYHRRAKPSDGGGTVLVAELMQQPNHWAGWMSKHAVGPLSPLRFAALLIRDLPPADVLERLAPALLTAEAEAAEIIIEKFDHFEDYKARPVTFEMWLSCWDDGGFWPYDDVALDAVAGLRATPDVEMYAALASEAFHDHTVTLWFLLGGIKNWVTSGDSHGYSKPETDWLVKLYKDEDFSTDPLAVLFRYQYERFRLTGRFETLPIPDDMKLDAPITSLEFDRDALENLSEEVILYDVERAAEDDDRSASLSEILQGDPWGWPAIAGSITSLRRQQLLSSTSLKLTPLGHRKLKIDREQDSFAPGVTESSDDDTEH